MRDLPEWAIPLGILISIITAFGYAIFRMHVPTPIEPESWLD